MTQLISVLHVDPGQGGKGDGGGGGGDEDEVTERKHRNL